MVTQKPAGQSSAGGWKAVLGAHARGNSPTEGQDYAPAQEKLKQGQPKSGKALMPEAECPTATPGLSRWYNGGTKEPKRRKAWEKKRNMRGGGTKLNKSTRTHILPKSHLRNSTQCCLPKAKQPSATHLPAVLIMSTEMTERQSQF